MNAVVVGIDSDEVHSHQIFLFVQFEERLVG